MLSITSSLKTSGAEAVDTDQTIRRTRLLRI